MKILTVDDSPAIRSLVINYLETILHESSFFEAKNGHEALMLAQQHILDLIVLDLEMPTMGGEECLKQLKADPTTKEIPVIMMSAIAQNGEVSRRLLGLGAARFVKKEGQPTWVNLVATTGEVLGLQPHHT